MFKIFTITALFALFVAASAVSVHVPGYKVRNLKVEKKIKVFPEENPGDIVDLNAISRQDAPSSKSFAGGEFSDFGFENFQTGFARVVETGIVVQKGTRGFLNFRIKARGTDAETISNADTSFSEVLENTSNSTLIQQYEQLKKDFGGSLNIPFLDFLGFDFLETFNEEKAADIAYSMDTTTYNALSFEAFKVLESFVETEVLITGTLFAEGVSFIPTTAVAFLRFTLVEFGENQSTNVFSSSSSDVIAATPRGQPLPSSGQTINIMPVTRR